MESARSSSNLGPLAHADTLNRNSSQAVVGTTHPDLPFRGRFRSVVHGVVSEDDVIVCEREEWEAGAESRQPGWCVLKQGRLVMAKLRVDSQ